MAQQGNQPPVQGQQPVQPPAQTLQQQIANLATGANIPLNQNQTYNLQNLAQQLNTRSRTAAEADWNGTITLQRPAKIILRSGQQPITLNEGDVITLTYQKNNPVTQNQLTIEGLPENVVDDMNLSPVNNTTHKGGVDGGNLIFFGNEITNFPRGRVQNQAGQNNADGEEEEDKPTWPYIVTGILGIAGMAGGFAGANFAGPGFAALAGVGAIAAIGGLALWTINQPKGSTARKVGMFLLATIGIAAAVLMGLSIAGLAGASGLAAFTGGNQALLIAGIVAMALTTAIALGAAGYLAVGEDKPKKAINTVTRERDRTQTRGRDRDRTGPEQRQPGQRQPEQISPDNNQYVKKADFDNNNEEIAKAFKEMREENAQRHKELTDLMNKKFEEYDKKFIQGGIPTYIQPQTIVPNGVQPIYTQPQTIFPNGAPVVLQNGAIPLQTTGGTTIPTAGIVTPGGIVGTGSNGSMVGGGNAWEIAYHQSMERQADLRHNHMRDLVLGRSNNGSGWSNGNNNYNGGNGNPNPGSTGVFNPPSNNNPRIEEMFKYLSDRINALQGLPPLQPHVEQPKTTTATQTLPGQASQEVQITPDAQRQPNSPTNQGIQTENNTHHPSNNDNQHENFNDNLSIAESQRSEGFNPNIENNFFDDFGENESQRSEGFNADDFNESQRSGLLNIPEDNSRNVSNVAHPGRRQVLSNASRRTIRDRDFDGAESVVSHRF